MDANSLSASALPWLWVTEFLASLEHVDANVLMNLLKRIPLEIPDDVSKNTREIVCLRILEGLFSRRSETHNGDSSEPHFKVGIDPSESCEDVCERILLEMSISNLTMGSPEMSKWDVQPFIMHKRDCLPKSALQQLKDAILQGSHPILASLKEKSGLAIRNQYGNRIPVAAGDDPNSIVPRLEWSGPDGQTMAAKRNLVTLTPENEDSLLQEDSPKRNLSPAKRGKDVLATENQMGEFYENQNSMDNGCDPHSVAANKLEQDATFTTQAKGQNLVPLYGNELLQVSSRRTLEHTGKEGCDLESEPQVGGLEESLSVVDGHDECAVSNRQNSDVDIAELQHKQLHIPCNDNEGPQDMSGDGPAQNICVDNAKDEVKDRAEMRMSNGSLPDISQQTFYVDEVRQSMSNDAPFNEAKDAMDHNSEPEMSSDTNWHHVDKIGIATMKHKLLSSRSAHSQDSFATVDSTELNLCIKCNKSGQLLACSATTCPLMVHESCLGSAACFDDRGNFFCPFCRYSQAISEYLELKKEASLKKKELKAFIGLGIEQQPKKCFKRLQSKQILLRQDESLDESNEANCIGNYLNEVSNPHNLPCAEKDEQQEEPSASCVNHNLPCAEKGANIIKGILGVSMEDKREWKEMGQECQSSSTLQGQQKEVQAFHHFDGDDSSCNATAIVCWSGKHAGVGMNREGDDTSCNATAIVCWNGKHAGVGMNQEVLQQAITVYPQVPTCPPNNDSGESSGEENDKSIALNYYIRCRKQETHYTYPAIPHTRRKKVPWTKMEVEMLKGGKCVSRMRLSYCGDRKRETNMINTNPTTSFGNDNDSSLKSAPGNHSSSSKSVLQEGVQRFSSVDKRSMPWKKILEFGCNVFKCRTTTDLKDKWRSICKGSSRSK